MNIPRLPVSFMPPCAPWHKYVVCKSHAAASLHPCAPAPVAELVTPSISEAVRENVLTRCPAFADHLTTAEVSEALAILAGILVLTIIIEHL